MSSRGKRAIIGFKNVISRNTVSQYHGYIVVWFANVASILLANKPVSELMNSDFEYIYAKLQQEKFLENIKERLEGEVDICRWSPIPRTGNDDIKLLNPCYAIEQIKNASLGRISIEKLQPALSLEFAEHVRTLLPRVSSSTKKSEVVGIASDILALAIVGAAKTFTYGVITRENRKKRKHEYGYVFIDVYNPAAVDMEKLNGMCRSVVHHIINGGGSKATLYVGVASAIALNIGRRISTEQQFVEFNLVRMGSTQNKNLLNTFDTVNLVDLSKVLVNTKLARPIYSLIISYPSENDLNRKEARTVRSFIEELARSILAYCFTHSVEDMYRALRMLSPGNVLYEDAMRYLGKDKWENIVSELLHARIL